MSVYIGRNIPGEAGHCLFRLGFLLESLGFHLLLETEWIFNLISGGVLFGGII